MPPSWIRPSPRSTTPLCFGPSTPVCSWRIFSSLHSLAKVSVDELGAVVRPEALDAVTNVGQEYLRCRGHVGRALAPEGVELYPMRVASILNLSLIHISEPTRPY